MKTQEEIFTELVHMYSEKLYWHVRSIVGTHDDADDIVQDSFAKAWKSLPGFRGDSDYFTWLWRISTNEAVNFLRKKKLRSYLPLSGRDDVARDVAGDCSFDGDEATLKLYKAIDALPARQKSVFCMRYFEELPYSRIAEITGVSESSLKASYHIAAEKVKIKLS